MTGLKKNREFLTVYKNGKSKADVNLVLYAYHRNEPSEARVGISVSKKLGNAAERNKIKRQVRTMVAEATDFRSGFDTVIIVRNRYNERSYQENKKELLKIYETVYNNDVDQPNEGV